VCKQICVNQNVNKALNIDPITSKTKEMENKEPLNKSEAHIIVEIIEYVHNAVVSRTIIKKTTGNVIATSIALGEELGERAIPFDTYVQIIDGKAQVNIENKKMDLSIGQGIIIPAHAHHSFTANEQFKMISTVIKSGYDE